MAIKQSKHIFRGMNKDLSDDKQRAEYYIDAKNIRITAREDSTLLSVTNEKGNTDLHLEEFMQYPSGSFSPQYSKYIGHCVLDNKIILFTKNTDKQIDQISVISLNPKKIKILYSGNLNFDPGHPIEAIADYETDAVQKVYWTDGLNQPRVINIAGNIKQGNDSQFDFVPEVVLDGQNIDVRIEKLTNTAGVLKAGTIQYFITFFNKFGQESNVVWQSPVLYVSPFDRGGAVNETVSNSFKLELTISNSAFDYIRIYSIQHTSEDTDLIGRKVIDIPVSSNTITFIDNGSQGESINPPDLYYKGGIPIAVGTMSAKDQTLFLGNLKLQNLQTVDKTIKDYAKELNLEYNSLPAFPTDDAKGKLYDYTSQLNEVGQMELIPNINSLQNDYIVSHTISSFKYLETYRFGLQFQDKYGLWSEPVWVCDKQNPIAPKIEDFLSNRFVHSSIPSVNLSPNIVDELKNKGYIKVRPLIVFPKEYERECIAQGVLNPTVYNLGDRKNNSPYAQPSWFFRPYGDYLGNDNKGILLPFKHNSIIQGKTSKYAEIEKAHYTQIPPVVSVNDTSLNDDMFFIDQNIFTLNSPDFEDNKTYDTSGYKFRIIGAIDVTGFSGSLQMQISNSPNNYYKGNWSIGDNFNDFPGTTEPTVQDIAEGYLNTFIQEINISDVGYGIMGTGGFWYDTPYAQWSINDDEYIYPSLYRYAFTVYPWQAAGSLNNTTNKISFKIEDVTFSINNNSSNLKYKVFANLRYSSNTIYKLDQNDYCNDYILNDENLFEQVTDIQIIDSKTIDNIIIHGPSNKSFVYYSNIDKLLGAPNNNVDEDITKNVIYDTELNQNNILTKDYYKKIYDYDIFVTDYGHENVNVPSSKQNKCATNGNFVLRKKMCIRNEGGLMTDPIDQLQYRYHVINNSKLCTKATSTSITYKSSKHAVITLSDYETSVQTILPSISFNNSETKIGRLSNSEGINNSIIGNTRNFLTGKRYAWDRNYTAIHQDNLNIIGNKLKDKGILLLGEIYREVNNNIRFGGNSDDALEQNIWLPAGEIKNIDTDTTIYWTEGDTYFQRYDCLKTYPYSDESMNNIVEILSFMCETRVNIAGRYDKNRGLIDNTFINEKNFNLINTVYNQKDNFFTYNILDDRFDLNVFKNQLTWSKIKSAGAEIDNWTNITLTNTLDLDGDKGEIISLNRYKNDILAFQPYGISQIIYNPNVQISTNNNMPIELTNSGRVEGKRYLYEGIGCQNKWSICDKANGSIFFIDNYNKSIYKLSDQGLVSLTDIKGFRSWMQNNNPSKPWVPSSAAPGYDYGFMTFYDSLYKDVYFINNKTCLVYSDLLNEFVSFMGYDKTDMMCNVNDKLYAIPSQDESNRGLKLYEQFASNDHCIFYDREAEPYYIEFVENQYPEVDKIFTNVEFRADLYEFRNEEYVLSTNGTFNTVQVYNEYQDTGKVPIKRLVDRPSLIQKKFRIWRIQIPYDTLDKDHKFNRIRNTWAKIKLSKQNLPDILPDIDDGKITDKMVLHDAVVTYHI